MPMIDAAIGYHAAGSRQCCKPVDRIDLMDHPLIRNSRRERPEQPEFQILTRIEGLEGSVDQKFLPVRIGLAQLRNQLRTPPASGLVDIPGHFDRNDVAELSRLDKVVRVLIP